MIKQKEYARRRKQLMQRSGEGAIVIVCAAPARIRNNDVHYSYRQHSDFLYLTGFREPDAALILGLPRGQFYSLFMILIGAAFIVVALKNKRRNQPVDVQKVKSGT